MEAKDRKDRREFLKATAGATALTVTSGLGLPARAQQKTLVFNDSGGASAEAGKLAYGDPFKAETGVEVKITAPAVVSKLKAMVQAKSVEWDVAELVSQEHRLAIREGLIQKLDKGIVNTAGLVPGSFDDYSVVFAYYSTAMGYNREKFADDAKRPKSWAEFWDVQKFPGRRALRNHPVDNLEFALQADGVPKDKIYPIDLDRAFKSLDRIKKHVAVWWKDGAQPAQMLLDGEVDFTSGWHGRFYALAQKGEKRIGCEWTGGMVKASWAGVPVGAPNPAEAMKFIAMMIRPQNSAKYAEGISYISGEPKAFDLLPAQTKEWVVTNPAVMSRMVVANEDWWLDNLATAQQRWNDWIAV
ncbi:MAG: ABC transporter substrate-binding protein [Alphaproteobacteria bacterium]|nr:ABC transporter substrate-binding protein [Alphaproteobacteria bacterium]